jgi:hypothetical protein
MVLPAGVQDFPGDDEFVGPNPEEAASIVYSLKRRHMFGDLLVEVYDSDGNLMSTHPGGKRRGLNRVAWPMRLKSPKVPPATSLVAQMGAFVGPRVPEGTYRVRLVKGNDTYESTISLVVDPRSASTPEDRALQDRSAMRLYHMLSDMTYDIESAISLRDQARERADSLGGRGGLARRLTRFADQLEEFRVGLVSTTEAGMFSGEERLRERLVDLYGAVNGYEGRPTGSQLNRMEVLAAELTEARTRFAELIEEDLDDLNGRLTREKMKPLVLLSREEWEDQ